MLGHVNRIVLLLLLSVLLPGPKYFLFSGIPIIGIGDNILLAFLLILVVSRRLLGKVPVLKFRRALAILVSLGIISFLKIFSFFFLNSYYQGSYNYWPIIPANLADNVCESNQEGCFMGAPAEDRIIQYKNKLGLGDLKVRIQDVLEPDDQPTPAFSADNIFAFPEYSRRDASINFHADPRYHFSQWGYGSWRLSFFNTKAFAGIAPFGPGRRLRNNLPFLAHWKAHADVHQKGITITLRGELIIKENETILFNEKSYEKDSFYFLRNDALEGKPLEIIYGYQEPVLTGFPREGAFAPRLKIEGIQPLPNTPNMIHPFLDNTYTAVIILLLMVIGLHILQSRKHLKKELTGPSGIIALLFAACMIIGFLFVRGNQVLIWKAGADPITYDHHAFEILSQRSLHGSESVFWYTPGHRYVVALGHLLFGEGHNYLVFLYGGFTLLFSSLLRHFAGNNRRLFLRFTLLSILFFAYPTFFVCFDGRNEISSAVCFLSAIMIIAVKRDRGEYS